MSPIINNSTQRIKNSTRHESKPNSQEYLKNQCPPFSTIQIRHSLNIKRFWHSMNHTSVCPKTINCTLKNSSKRKKQRNTISSENSTQRKKFSNKIRCLRLRHITQCKNEEENTKEWHCGCCSSKIFLSFCMCTIIKITNKKKLCRTSNSVSKHCKNRSNNTDFVQPKQCKNHHTHVGNTTVCNNFFLIDLAKSCLTCIHNTNQTNSTYKGCKIKTCFWKEIKIKTLESVCSKFQQNTRQQNTSSCTSFNMGFWQPQVKWHLGNFHCKSLKESPPHETFDKFRNSRKWSESSNRMPQLFIMCCSCETQQKQKNWLHCQTPKKSVKNLQISSFYFSSTTSTKSNQQKHWNQRAFIKHVKTKNVKTCKACKKKTLQTEKKAIKACAMSILCIPTTLNGQRHQDCSEQNHPKIQSINTKFKIDSLKTTPMGLKTNHLRKWRGSSWNKTGPLPQAQKQGS